METPWRSQLTLFQLIELKHKQHVHYWSSRSGVAWFMWDARSQDLCFPTTSVPAWRNAPWAWLQSTSSLWSSKCSSDSMSAWSWLSLCEDECCWSVKTRQQPNSGVWSGRPTVLDITPVRVPAVFDVHIHLLIMKVATTYWASCALEFPTKNQRNVTVVPSFVFFI